MSEPLFIVDSHLDIAWNAGLGRDFREPVAVTNQREMGAASLGTRVISLPDLLKSRVRVVFATIFVLPARAASQWEGPSFHNAEEAYRQGQAQLDYYLGLAAEDPRIALLCNWAELNQFLAEINQSDGKLEKLGIVLTMEGADPIRQPSELARWVEKGLRLLGPAWKSNQYCGGTGEPGPLTGPGYRLLEEMHRLKMILDVSHMAEETFNNALDTWPGQLIASHSNCRHFVPTDRQLSDPMIRRLTGREAVIGVVPYDNFLIPPAGEPQVYRKPVVEDWVAHLSHICEIAGNTTQVALGTDWDGGFGADKIPFPLKGPADLPLLGEALLRHGFNETDVQQIFYGNWIRVLEQGLRNF